MTKESGLVTAICVALQYYENQGKLYFIRNNSGAFIKEYTNKTGVKKKSFIKFGKRGSADIFIFLTTNKKSAIIGLEVKSENGKLSEFQKEFRELFCKIGGLYFVITDVEQVKNILDYAFTKDLYNLPPDFSSKT